MQGLWFESRTSGPRVGSLKHFRTTLVGPGLPLTNRFGSDATPKQDRLIKTNALHQRGGFCLKKGRPGALIGSNRDLRAGGGVNRDRALLFSRTAHLLAAKPSDSDSEEEKRETLDLSLSQT